MRSRLLLALLIGFLPAAGLSAEHAIVTLKIEEDGTVFWNGLRVHGDKELAEKARQYGKLGDRITPRIVVQRGTKEATIDHVAGVLYQTGCCILGVVNTRRP